MLNLDKQGEAKPYGSEYSLREFRIRRRICTALFSTAAIWLGFAALNFLGALVFSRGSLWLFEFLFRLSEITGIVMLSAALAVTYAIYRCPECDTYLSPFRLDEYHCPACDAQVKED